MLSILYALIPNRGSMDQNRSVKVKQFGPVLEEPESKKLKKARIGHDQEEFENLGPGPRNLDNLGLILIS